MADIALTRANRVEIVESRQQMTLAAAEDIVPGAPVRIAGDRFTNANGTTATEAAAYGVATGDVVAVAGMPITALREGVLDGLELPGTTGDPVYLSDTDGRLGTTAGTVSLVVGKVIPGTAGLLGTSHKLLNVELGGK